MPSKTTGFFEVTVKVTVCSALLSVKVSGDNVATTSTVPKAAYTLLIGSKATTIARHSRIENALCVNFCLCINLNLLYHII